MTASVNINRGGYCTAPTSVNRLLYKPSLRAGPFQISPAASSHPEGLLPRTLALPPSRSTPAARHRRARIPPPLRSDPEELPPRTLVPPPSRSTPAAVLTLNNRRHCSEPAATPAPPSATPVPPQYASLRLLLFCRLLL